MGQYHFNSHKTQNGYQAILQIFKSFNHMGQKEVHGPKPQNGKYIGAEHQKRIGGYGQYGRNTVQSEQNIRELDNYQCHKQGGRCGYMAQFYKELLTIHVRCNRHYFSQVTIKKGLFRFEGLLLGNQHFNSCKN